jgi:hypothetical protein
MSIIGQNPATDLRGAGLLSLMQLLHFITEPKSQHLARNIYKLSLHETQVSLHAPDAHEYSMF